jgi:hypothetical protein
MNRLKGVAAERDRELTALQAQESPALESPVVEEDGSPQTEQSEVA